MKVLLFSDDEELRGRLLFHLEGQAGARVVEAPTLERAVQLTEEAGWELIVYAMAGGRLPESEHVRFWQAVQEVPAIFSAPVTPESKAAARKLSPGVVEIVAPDKFVAEISAIVQRLVDQGQFERDVPDMGYCRISTGLLLALSPLKADIYIRLSSDKFLRLMKAGDEFNVRDLEKYRDHKGVEYLWLEAADLVHFLKRTEDELQKQLIKAHQDPDGTAKLVMTSQASIKEIIGHLGVTKEVQSVAKLQVENTIKSMQANWQLSRLITHLKEEGGFIAYHSMLLAYISCMIAQRTPWAGEYTAHKLSFAAFLHDLALKNQELATLDSLADLDRRRSEFTDQDALDFKLHPARAAELCRRFKEAPFDVETIVIQHHERPDGMGFPRGLIHSQINPLSAIMIVAHELIYFMRNGGKSFQMDDFIECMRPYYRGDFQIILEAIRKG